MTHIVACIPFARDYIFRKFFLSWTGMFTYARGKYDLSCATVYGPYIDTNRDILTKIALDMEADYILFLDDDQIYPHDTPERLLSHGKDLIGGVTPIKDDAKPMIWDFDAENKRIRLWDSIGDQSGLAKIDGMGLGGVLIKASVFDRLEPPFFKIQDKCNYYSQHGEDITFYLKCKDAGIDMWVDLDLQYGHLFMQEIRLGDTVRH